MEVLRELSILLDLAPAMCCDLSLPVSGSVYATDASRTGAGVTYCDSVVRSVGRDKSKKRLEREAERDGTCRL